MKKTKFIIFIVSSIITYFLFNAARAAAIAERGNSYALGGECLILLLPFIVIMTWENIKLSKGGKSR